MPLRHELQCYNATMVFEDVYYRRCLQRDQGTVRKESRAQGSDTSDEICVPVCQSDAFQTDRHVYASAAWLALTVDTGERVRRVAH